MTDDFVDRMKRKIIDDRKALAALATVTCPFCGHAGAVTRERRREHQGAYSSRFWAECGNDLCCCHGRQHDSEADAAREWLRLALAVQIADAGKRCEEELDGSRKRGNFRQELRRLLEQWEVDDEDDPDA